MTHRILDELARSRLRRSPPPKPTPQGYVYRGQRNLEAVLESPAGGQAIGRQVTNGAIANGDTPLVLTAGGQNWVIGPRVRRKEVRRSPSLSIRWETYEYKGATWTAQAGRFRSNFVDGTECGGTGLNVQSALLAGYLYVPRRAIVTFFGEGSVPIYIGESQYLIIRSYSAPAIASLSSLQAIASYMGYANVKAVLDTIIPGAGLKP